MKIIIATLIFVITCMASVLSVDAKGAALKEKSQLATSFNASEKKWNVDKFVAALISNELKETVRLLENNKGEIIFISPEEDTRIKIEAYKNTSLELLPEEFRNYVKLYIMRYNIKSGEGNSKEMLELRNNDIEFESKWGMSWIELYDDAKKRVLLDLLYYIILEYDYLESVMDDENYFGSNYMKKSIEILDKISIKGTGLKLNDLKQQPLKVSSQINADKYIAAFMSNKQRMLLTEAGKETEMKKNKDNNELIVQFYKSTSLDLLPEELRECVKSFIAFLENGTDLNKKNYLNEEKKLKEKWELTWEELFENVERKIYEDIALTIYHDFSSLELDSKEYFLYKQNIPKRVIQVLDYISKNGTSGDPHSDNKKSPIPSVPFPNLKLADLNGVASSEKKNADEMPETKNKMKCITWIGGWGVEIDQFNETDQKMPVDFDWITMNVESKKFNGMCRIPFSFKGVIPPKKNNKYIIPLNDINLPVGDYKLGASFEKKEKTDKRWPERMQFSIVFEIEMPQFMSPPEDYKKVSQIKESDVFLDFTKPALAVTSENYKGDLAIKGDEYKIPINVYYHCSPQNGDLLVRMRTESAQEDKPFVGEIFCPPSVDSEEKARPLYGRRTHTALARLKIKITTGKDTKTIYHPLPVYFFLPAGEKCEFMILLKNVEWDEKKSRLEIEHQSIPEGSFVNCFPLPFSQMIFHKDKDK